MPGEGRVEVSRPLASVRSSISVTASVPGAAILIDGVDVGRTPLASPVDVEEGTHDSLVAAHGRYAKMFELQAEGYR